MNGTVKLKDSTFENLTAITAGFLYAIGESEIELLNVKVSNVKVALAPSLIHSIESDLIFENSEFNSFNGTGIHFTGYRKTMTLENWTF